VDPQDSPRVIASGTYRVSSRIDITAEALLPDQAEEIVSTLRDFSTAPAHTLITTADEAGVPAIGELRSVLPDVLESRLEGWIDDEIENVTIDGMPVTAYAAQIAALADTALTHVAVTSELTIDGASARHRLTGLDLTPSGLAVSIPFGDVAADLLTQSTTASTAAGALRLGDHRFGLAYGEYAWQGLEAMSQARHGGSIRATLGAAVNCPVIAHRVASHCVFGVCVGHEPELTSVCDAGLDAIVDLAHDRMAELRIDALHFASGQAILVDDNRDGIADHLTGSWQAELNLGQGLRHTPASFTAAR
jgi:hypothetical protein